MKRSIILGLVALLILTACGGSAANSMDSIAGGAGAASVESAMPAAETSADFEAPVAEQKDLAMRGQVAQGAPNPQAPLDRLVIRTATLRMLVADVLTAEAQVRQLAESRGGYVLSSQSAGEGAQRSATVSFKVPARRFDEAIGELGKLAQRVDSQDVAGQDVTDEFVDLESRLRNLRAVETRLLNFLNDASRVEDLLQINQQLAEVQGQIEQTQGRINYLKDSAALSTITVALYMNPVVEVVPEEGWSPLATARLALKQLVALAQVLANAAIVIAVWSPAWGLVLLAGLWLRRRFRATPSATPAPQAPAQTPQP